MKKISSKIFLISLTSLTLFIILKQLTFYLGIPKFLYSINSIGDTIFSYFWIDYNASSNTFIEMSYLYLIIILIVGWGGYLLKNKYSNIIMLILTTPYVINLIFNFFVNNFSEQIILKINETIVDLFIFYTPLFFSYILLIIDSVTILFAKKREIMTEEIEILEFDL